MNFISFLKRLGSTIGCLFLFSAVLNCQTYSFKNYGAESNIPNGFVYTINQTNDGFLWVGTGSGISRFDGFAFYPVQFPDSSAGRLPEVSLKDKNGTVWFGCSDGSVFYSKGTNLYSIQLSNTRSISDLLEGPDGSIYVIPQGGAIFTINPKNTDEIRRYDLSGDPVLFSASFASSGRLLLGTQESIMICILDGDTVSVADVIEEFDYYGVTSIQMTTDSTRFIIGTDGNGIFQLETTGKKNSLTRFPDHPEWDNLSIESISVDANQFIWVSSFGEGVIQFQLSDDKVNAESVLLFNTSSGLNTNDVKTVFQDIEGNFWLALYGDGISMMTSYAFSYYMPGKNPLENNVIYVDSYRDRYLLGTPSGFHLFDPVTSKSVSFSDLTGVLGKTEITSYYLYKKDLLFIGTGGKGLFIRYSNGTVSQFYRNGDSGADFIKDIEIYDQNIWLATTNGVIVIDRISGKEKKRFDINNGLPHNSINYIFIDSGGKAFIGTESDRLYSIDRDFKIEPANAIMSGSTINKVLSITGDKHGFIWAATKGNGVFKCFQDSLSSVSRADDLLSNYCYSIMADSENEIWIGHEKGFSIFDPESGRMRIFGTDFVRSGVCNAGGMFESPDKKVFIGTTDGLIIYDRLKDRKKLISPFNNINSVTINDISYPYQPSYSLPYNKKYLVRIYFSGIHFSDPEKVFYSTYLENYDNEWSKMSTSREVSYSLSYGKYIFNLQSVDEEGLSEENPVSFEISIKKPFWKTWWFVLASIASFCGIIFIIIKERDKSQKKIQEYLEKELDARTSVVMKQKGEIELQNIEITDSINYAKRIQTSILPDINKLKASFRDAFILFHPRDIVSGDFYWFDKLGDDKFIIVCADSTGHGVPGAFMSMIGSTLLQDIVTRQGISQPSEILYLLDKQIFSTLNQNVELGVSNDGMDMVVCEFDLKTRHIRFSSAMRPVILVLDGEPYYIKGNRLSVGGESVIEKYFDDQEYYLNEGDTVYLFSDGFSDQFGGPDGKKMKIARFKRLIDQVSALPMEEQKAIISKFFFEWKGSFDQVDDVILMGVKV